MGYFLVASSISKIAKSQLALSAASIQTVIETFPNEYLSIRILFFLIVKP